MFTKQQQQQQHQEEKKGKQIFPVANETKRVMKLYNSEAVKTKWNNIFELVYEQPASVYNCDTVEDTKRQQQLFFLLLNPDTLPHHDGTCGWCLLWGK